MRPCLEELLEQIALNQTERQPGAPDKPNRPAQPTKTEPASARPRTCVQKRPNGDDTSCTSCTAPRSISLVAGAEAAAGRLAPGATGGAAERGGDRRGLGSDLLLRHERRRQPPAGGFRGMNFAGAEVELSCGRKMGSRGAGEGWTRGNKSNLQRQDKYGFGPLELFALIGVLEPDPSHQQLP